MVRTIDNVSPRNRPDASDDATNVVWRSTNRPQIVFIDDEKGVLDGVRRMLRRHSQVWDLHFFEDSVQAWEFLRTRPADVIICDIKMPGMTGVELLERVQECPRTKGVPVVMLTGIHDAGLKHEMMDLGAADLLNKPVHAADLLARVRSVLRIKSLQDELLKQNEKLEHQVQTRTRQLRRSRMQIIWRLAKAAEFRDVDTGEHIVRVACYARILAEHLKLPKEVCDALFLAAPLHDIGKLAIPDSILLKPGRLTDEERRTMQEHCAIGRRILEEPSLAELCFQADFQDDSGEVDPLLHMAQQIAMSHHERWNGTGYPLGLREDAIPLAARIVAVADVYDAASSPRPYKPAWSQEHAQRLIEEGRGAQFDPQIVDAFVASSVAIQSVRKRTSDAVALLSSRNESELSSPAAPEAARRAGEKRPASSESEEFAEARLTAAWLCRDT